MARVIGAVGKGDLTQTVAMEIDGVPLQGNFQLTRELVERQLPALVRDSIEPAVQRSTEHAVDRIRTEVLTDVERRVVTCILEAARATKDGFSNALVEGRSHLDAVLQRSDRVLRELVEETRRTGSPRRPPVPSIASRSE